MYGNGFGPVIPNIPAGELVQEQNQLAASMEITFGEGVIAALAHRLLHDIRVFSG
jgi:hypothetical protein